MNKIESEIKDLVGKLFSEKKIDVFIGYQKGTLPLRTTPCFIRAENLDKLVWNSLCSNNLAVYLSRISPNKQGKEPVKTGILCKGCDSRSLVGLIKENQLCRDNVFIIGINCPGMIDIKKITAETNGAIEDVDENDGDIQVKYKDGTKKFNKKEYLYECCRNCVYTVPVVHDILIGDSKNPPVTPAPSKKILDFLNRKREERWQIFEKELSKCIRCYACRNACPNCYCKECFAEQTRPQWFSTASDLSDKIFYHIGRIFHQAGRCVDCGACVRACPMDIDLNLFTRMLVDEVKERFGYDPGLNIDEAPPLATFATEDKQEFIVEPPQEKK